MPRIVPGRKSITTIYTDEQYDQIRILASKKNTSMNAIVREFTEQGLNGLLTQDNLDVLVPVIREQLSSILNPAIDRLASLSAKTCVQAGAAAYLSAEAILKFVPPDMREEVGVCYEAARKKAVMYAKSRVNIED